MTEALFDNPTVYTEDRQRATLRAFALGGVLQVLRAGKGWSVEQAAVHANLGHMTWRRMEDGYSVRNKTYAAVDSLFELPFGTTKRALADDLLMVQLIARVGVDTSEVTTASASGFVDRFAQQTLSNAARKTVAARTGRGPDRTGRPGPADRTGPDELGQLRDAVHAASAARALATPPVSDLEAMAQMIDRLTRRTMTPRLESAVRAMLDAMPELIAVQVEQAVEAESAHPAAPGEEVSR